MRAQTDYAIIIHGKWNYAKRDNPTVVNDEARNRPILDQKRQERWKTVRHLFDQRDYVHALFFAHLYLEKLLKALVVQNTELHSPYGYRLRALAQEANLPLTTEQIVFL